jgi:putative glycosyltransferase (TIGR04348 family)
VKISLITPAKKQSRAGNRTTAVRWAAILRRLGHRVAVSDVYDGAPADMMVALHAWRSAEAIERFHGLYPGRPLVVSLTGTDIYRFQESHPDTTTRSMELADALVCLHDQVHRDIPSRFRPKLHVIHQSAKPLPGRKAPAKRHFNVCVIGHLREEKDPLRAALAARRLALTSRIRVIHAGKAIDQSWVRKAEAEMARNPRYRWLGDVPGWQVRRLMGRSRLMVISSRMEGGANVVSEAIVAGLPVIGSDIAGNIGLLGEDYPGTYPVEDADALRRLLERAEGEPGFLETLKRHCRERRFLFRPGAEFTAWKDLVQRLTTPE